MCLRLEDDHTNTHDVGWHKVSLSVLIEENLFLIGYLYDNKYVRDNKIWTCYWPDFFGKHLLCVLNRDARVDALIDFRLREPRNDKFAQAKTKHNRLTKLSPKRKIFNEFTIIPSVLLSSNSASHNSS